MSSHPFSTYSNFQEYLTPVICFLAPLPCVYNELGDAGFFGHETILARIYLFVNMMFDVIKYAMFKSLWDQGQQWNWSVIFYFIFFSMFIYRDYVREFPLVRYNTNTREQRDGESAWRPLSVRARKCYLDCVLCDCLSSLWQLVPLLPILWCSQILCYADDRNVHKLCPSQRKRWKQNIYWTCSLYRCHIIRVHPFTLTNLWRHFTWNVGIFRFHLKEGP